VAEQEKRAIFKKEREAIVFFAERILPRIFSAYEYSIHTSSRQKMLQVIDKSISLLDEDMVKSFIEPISFSKFIYGKTILSYVQPS